MDISVKLKKVFAILSLFLPLLMFSIKVTASYVYTMMCVLFVVNVMFLFLHRPAKIKLILFACFTTLTLLMYLGNI